MEAFILAAGRGSRLGSLTDERPKGMVEVAGRPMLNWQYDALRAAGVEQIRVVTGYRGEVIAEAGFETLPNPDWQLGNMLTSLATVLDCTSGPILISYADILYEPSCVRALLATDAALALTYDKDWESLWRLRFADPLSDAETFRINEQGLVQEIGGSPDSVVEVQGQFMGLFKIQPEGRKWIESLLRESPGLRLTMDTTALFSRLIAAGHPVVGVPVNGGWCEVDDQADRDVAEALITQGHLRLEKSLW